MPTKRQRERPRRLISAQNVEPPSFVTGNEHTQDTRKYSWTLLKCWSKRMYAAFEAHINSNYLEYSRKGLAKKFYTTIHGQKREGITTEDPEFQIFEIQTVGRLEDAGKGVHKLQIEASEIKCANNMESGRPIQTWILTSHLELADTLHNSVKTGDYLAVWGALYNKKSRSAFLNSFDKVQVPKTVMAVYRHKNSSDHAKNLDSYNMPFQERKRNVSYHLIQEGEGGICDLVEEILPKPKRTNGWTLQEDNHSDQDSDHAHSEKGDSDIGFQEVVNTRQPPATPKPSTSAEAKRVGSQTNSTPTTGLKTPAKRTPLRALSDDAILKELDGDRGRTRSRSNSVEFVEEFQDIDVEKRGSKNTRSLKASKSTPHTAKKKNSVNLLESGSESSDDDPSFSPEMRTVRRKKRIRCTSGSSHSSMISSPRARRAAKNARVRLLNMSESEEDPSKTGQEASPFQSCKAPAENSSRRSKRAAKSIKANVFDVSDSEEDESLDKVAETASQPATGMNSSPRPKRTTTKVNMIMVEASDDEDEPFRKHQEKSPSRSPRKVEKNSSNAEKPKEPESQSQLTQNSIVLELETQRFGRSPSHSEGEGDQDDDQDNDSDWNPPEAKDSEKENQKSDAEKKSSPDYENSDSDEESLETKRQKKARKRVSRKLFTEEEDENRCAIPPKWKGVVKPLKINLNRDLADKYSSQSSSSTAGIDKEKEKVRKRRHN